MKVAVTGGIGAGKSYVCRILEQDFGIRVYDCDAAAKRLMRSSETLREGLVGLVGKDVYINKVLQKRVLAQFLLASDANKQAVDDVVHPAVARDFEQSGCDWLESAILFDSGFYRRTAFDRVVCVTAPIETRIRRVMERDGITREKALEWIGRQFPQEETARRSDYEIVNDGHHGLIPQIKRLLARLYPTAIPLPSGGSAPSVDGSPPPASGSAPSVDGSPPSSGGPAPSVDGSPSVPVV